MEGFQGRTSNYPEELRSFVASVSGASKLTEESGQISQTYGAVSSIGGGFSAGDALRIMERGFQFAIEADLVSNASRHSTQVLNDLLKGQ
jgi:phosphoribosylformylglycinamidine (FGAM) synthase-like amidotransferase family enzyme